MSVIYSIGMWRTRSNGHTRFQANPTFGIVSLYGEEIAWVRKGTRKIYRFKLASKHPRACSNILWQLGMSTTKSGGKWILTPRDETLPKVDIIPGRYYSVNDDAVSRATSARSSDEIISELFDPQTSFDFPEPVKPATSSIRLIAWDSVDEPVIGAICQDGTVEFTREAGQSPSWQIRESFL
jgi:hypothetical protein